ncbi:Endoglucanase II [Venustampulla echinocandica]|uniref:AA9 family lytic polysaccharide monooxygenase n=1 Tax=Venustampulla echinocandica TaxID=2656787 RepID=A0A370TIP2_9HELO|nr:Endoglucanase II [Venustampulla echinocandica]RDL35218.1 Endoglucanase II [Venustampulla echinocandica]
MKSFVTAVGLLVCATSVVGHSIFQDLWVDGWMLILRRKDQVSTCARMPLSNSPVTSVSSNDIRCNAGTKPVTGVCSVPAGGEITVEMHAQPGDRNCKNEAIGGNHFGPVMIYMSKVSSSASDPGSGKWFKIAEEGYDTATKKWGTDSLNSNCGKKSVKVPASLAPGDYLVRAEAIALHSAGSAGGAQFYMTCFQINLTGSGTANPPGVSFPGAYSANDPGILINIYQTITKYIIPGPAVWTG